MLDALFEKETADTLDDRQRNPLRPSTPEPSAWAGVLSAAPRGFAIAANESARALHRTLTAARDNTLRRQQGEVDDFTAEEILRRRVTLDEDRAEVDQALRAGADYWRADPATQGTAAMVIQGAAQFLTKAGVYTAATRNPWAVSALMGADTGTTEYLSLLDQGVDEATARKVGAVRGLGAAVAVALPAAGSTIGRTAALAAAGGPGAYVAENLAARAILRDADYSAIADQVDPFDPVGLAVSTIGAAGVGGAAYWFRARGARGKALPEEVDAARVILAREAADANSLAKPGDIEAATRDTRAAETAEAQIARGERVDVSDVAPVRPGDPVPETLREFERKVDEGLSQIPDAPRPPGSDIPRSTDSLTPGQRAIESRFASEIANVDAAALRYAALKDAEGGKVLNTDTARELSADYLADRSQSAAVHEPASWLIKQIYARKLAEDPGPGERPLVLFTAGGTGAGKTSALRTVKEAADIKASAQIVYDTNMNTYKSSRSKIDQALDANKLVRIVLVARDPVDALRNGALPRAAGQEAEFGSGRTVPLHEHKKTHDGALSVVERLAKEFKDDPRVLVQVIDNSFGKGNARLSTLDEVRGRGYTSTIEDLQRVLDEEHKNGRVSEATYRGFAGKAPDGGRSGLVQGVEQDLRSGAGRQPEPQRPARAQYRAEVAGSQAEVVTERGLALPVRYKVVDARDLITSHDDALRTNPQFPEQLQPRDRSRAASEAQIAKIEGNIDPELLAESRKASDGAPVVGIDSVVESGNARTIALRRAYGSGKADGYRAWLVKNADRFGMKAADIEAVERPVLIRETAGDYNRAEFARQANEAAQARMSASEQAKVDAQRMPDLDRLATNDDGTINVPQSREFLRDFFESVVSPAELNDMVTPDGRPSAAALSRIRNALFAKAYGDAELVSMLTESTDANIRNVLAGMTRAAPDIAKLRDNIAAGARHPIDFSADVATAARLLSRLRAEGVSVDAFLAQQTFLDPLATPEVASVLRGLSDNARSATRVADMMRNMAGAVDALGDPRQASMFDAPSAKVSDIASAAQAQIDLAAKSIAVRQPDLEIEVEVGGQAKRMRAADAIAAAEDAMKAAKETSRLLEVAAQCAMGVA